MLNSYAPSMGTKQLSVLRVNRPPRFDPRQTLGQVRWCNCWLKHEDCKAWRATRLSSRSQMIWSNSQRRASQPGIQSFS